MSKGWADTHWRPEASTFSCEARRQLQGMMSVLREPCSSIASVSDLKTWSISSSGCFTELSKMERRGIYPLYDFTLSPFTSGANDREPEPNFYRVEGTHIGQRNFAIFDVTGKRKERILKCTIFDKDGKELWKYSINENDLK